MSMAELAGLGALDRFRIDRCLGRGSFGTVYEAYDRERETIVALKALRVSDPAIVYRFKQEFRSLTDLSHFNLVKLYELMSHDGQWFFTMELVRGVDFLAYVRQDSILSHELSEAPTGSGWIDAAAGSPHLDSPTPQPRALPFAGLNLERLRPALRQLAEGVCALHRNGVLHRDIKPSNILVTPEGRVVLVDFGLARQLASTEATVELVGTPEYMSPEQAGAQPVSEASDWYSVGIVLYRALTGAVPFSGGFFRVLMDKRSAEALPPSRLTPEVPPDLDALCRDLVRLDARRRPAGHVVLERLAAASVSIHADEPALDAGLFVGRSEHLRVLETAFREMEDGRSVTVFLHGVSGIGKTSLVRRFLAGLRKDVLVLEGRCYEQESVPYKALDSLVDDLSRYLMELPEPKVEALLPLHTFALVRLFPVLARANAVAREQQRAPVVTDSQELKRRASSALRELLARLAARQPTVLVIDDLQWGDADSALLIGEFLRHPEPPALMIVGCYRSDEVQTSPFLRTLLSEREAVWTTRIHEVKVTELTTQESSDLAHRLLGGSEDSAQAETIARESGGSPFLLGQLAQGGTQSLTLEGVLRERVQSLNPQARSLLEVVAVAGQPIDTAAAVKAAGVESSQFDAIATLRSARFIRVRSADRGGRLETYHDRIRETVASGISGGERTGIHTRLAVTLEAAGHADKEVLAVHFHAAGHLAKAAGYAELAAKEASGALAFERAARLYHMALDIDVVDSLKRQNLRIELARVLANAGHCAKSAEMFLLAAEGLGGAQAVECRRRAADQYLTSGHIDEGFEQLNHVLRAIGMKLPRTPARAIASLIFWRIRLRLRGLRFKERPADQTPPEELFRIDTCHSVCRGLGLIDSILALQVQPQHLLLALNAGEPNRIRQALSFELCAAAATYGKGARTDKLLAICNELAERARDSFAIAEVRVNVAMADMLMGRWRESVDGFAEAERLLHGSRRLDSYHELTVTHLYRLNSLFYLGAIREFSSRIPDLLDRYQARGDLYAEVHLRTHYARMECFVNDAPDAADAQLDWVIRGWSQRAFHLQHYDEALIRVQVALYRGEPQRAWEMLEAKWKQFSRSHLLRVQVVRILLLDLRARAALAVAASPSAGDRGASLVKAAGHAARRIAKEQTPWGNGLAQLIHAGVSTLSADRIGALEALKLAERQFERASMHLHADVVRRRRSEMLGNEEGRALLEHSNQWMTAEGIRNPSRVTELLAPGFWS